MSTQKWSDDDLDDLFRKSAEESDPAYDPAAWQDLQTRLNNRDRTLLRTKLVRWGLPALLLLLVTGSTIWYTQRQSRQESTPITTASTNARPTESVAGAPATNQPAGDNIRQGVTTQKDQPEVAGQPLTGSQTAIPRDLSTNKQQEQGASSEPTVPAEPASERKAVDRTATVTPLNQHPGSSAVGQTNERKVRQTPLADLKPEPAGAVDQPSRTAKRINSPSFGGSVANHTVTERLSINRIERTTSRKVKPQPVPDIKASDALVAGRRSSHLTSTARQDAKIGGLGRQRSVVPGLVTSQGSGGHDQPNSVTGDEYYSTPSVVVQQEAVITADRFVWPTLSVLTARQIKSPAPPALTAEPVAPGTTEFIPSLARPRLSGLSVQFVLSPDLSSIGLRNFDRPGTNIGVMAQYQLSDRLSVQAGALWSTKLYKTSASEYTWPVPAGMSALPESIDGKCTMLDLPLNLRYDILLRPGRADRGPIRWFVSAGITSYFIDHEVYKYTYANPYDPSIKYQGWDNKAAGRKGGSFGLSNLNVSIGYERPIGKRLSWQIEPFMKVPLKEVGYFKVKLLSTGAFLSLRYHL